jgi:ATP diphosphatase
MNPEDALRAATGRFEARFRMMELGAQAEGRSLEGMSLEELDQRWQSAKQS